MLKVLKKSKEMLKVLMLMLTFSVLEMLIVFKVLKGFNDDEKCNKVIKSNKVS